MNRLGIFFILAASLGAAPARLQVLQAPESIPVPSNVRIFFSPWDNLPAAVVAAIAHAKSEILVMQTAINDPKIGAALVDAYRDPHRKLIIGIILQEAPSVPDYETPAYFAENHIPFVYARAGSGRAAARYCVIDRRIVITGSYPWLASAKADNADLFVVDEPGIAAAYVKNWIEVAQTAKIPAADHP